MIHWISENWFWFIVFPLALVLIVSTIASRAAFGYWFFPDPDKHQKVFHKGGHTRNPYDELGEAIFNQPYSPARERTVGKSPVLAAPYGDPRKAANTATFVVTAKMIGIEAMQLLDQRSKKAGAYLLAAACYLDESNTPGEVKPYILVRREDLLRWAQEWQDEHDPRDGTDVVTPFDHYLYY